MLKRKLDEGVGEGEGTDTATPPNGQSESDDSNCSAGSTDALAPEACGPSPPKRMKKKVNFKGVTVYYFPRRQGFTCVPSEGGSTLGMSERHSFTRDFSLTDYTKEQKRIHRAILAEQRRQGKMFPSPLLASSVHNQEDDDVSSGSESDSEYDDYYFLQPLPIRQRRVLLRTAGVKKIDNEEKDECRDIRVSRNICGCDCKVFCDPATCTCSIAGIQCQVDRLSFPCGCTKDGCGNPAGRIEFNPIRVRTHFIHTLMRLELERKDSESPESTSASVTTASFLRSPTTNVDIDVVGANGEESEVVSTDNSDGTSNDSCSGASTDVSSHGKLVLKSRLKVKKAEAIDLNMFNSNEKGSCRDCQNTDMCNVMMHDVKFSMVTQQQQRQQQQQQQRAISAVLAAQPGYQGSPGQPQHHHLSLSQGISLLHPPPPPPQQQQQQQQQSSQHMLLFNDGEEEVYQAENTTSMYFDNDDSSYSEMSDTSPEGLEPRSFTGLNQGNFNGKFHMTPSQMFTTINSNNSKQTSIMSAGTSLLNPSCLQSLQASNPCGLSTPPSCSGSGIGVVEQQSCGLLSQTTPASASGQSMLRAPYLQPPCAGPPSAIVNTGLHLRPQIASAMAVDMEGSHMLQSSLPRFQNKLPHPEMMGSSGHITSTYKIDPTLLSPQTYSSDTLPTSADYLVQPGHLSPPSTGPFGSSSTTVTAITNFDPLPSPQLSACWSRSLVSPSLRDCFGLASPPALTSSIPGEDPSVSGDLIPCKSTFPPSHELCTANQITPTTTYATMTTTTRDLLAAHCPGISSHMDSKLEPPGSSAVKDDTTFPDYHVAGQVSKNSLLTNPQRPLYNTTYPEPVTGNTSAPFTPEDLDRKAPDLVDDIFVKSCLEPTATTQPSKLSTELPENSLLYPAEISTSLTLLTYNIPTSSSSNVQKSLCSSALATGINNFTPLKVCTDSLESGPTTLPATNLAVSQPGKFSGDNKKTLGLEVSKPDSSEVKTLGTPAVDLDSENRPCSLKGLRSSSWDDNAELCDLPDGEMSLVIPDSSFQQDGPETTSSTLQSLSSSPSTSEEEKESNVSPSFGEIMKESLVEMVLV
ncbi:unnamed protein product [Lymnaea stagnalis]|uniref:Cysteine/serine-rich nuclear protein N-terminal domain-containing protein n=1 Tax=Lymnaea stagnalis TaxID=6523 RepID=A0AAV2HQF0_LYMST